MIDWISELIECVMCSTTYLEHWSCNMCKPSTQNRYGFWKELLYPRNWTGHLQRFGAFIMLKFESFEVHITLVLRYVY